MEPVQWRPQAIADLARLVGHIRAENPIAAQRIAREIVLAADSLATFPNRGRRGGVSGTRELVAAYPYIVVYEVNLGQGVMIDRVWHGAQDRI